jgi:signal transduction histidine kinase
MNTAMANGEIPERTWLKTIQPSWPPVLRRYGFAVLVVLAAFAVRYALASRLGEELPFMLFIAAALAAAWYGGAAPGFLALLLGLLMADVFFLRPRTSVAMPRLVLILDVGRYLFTASVGITLIEVLHRNRRALQAAQRQLRMHAAELERHVAERTASLSASLRALEDILYSIAHNLRAPLRAMSGYSDLLVSDYSKCLNQPARTYLAQIGQSSARMDGMISDLLEYGRLAHTALNLRPVDIKEIVQKAVVLLSNTIRSKNAIVVFRGTTCKAQSDRTILEQVLVNLLENSIKFTSPETIPRVEIRAERLPDSGRVRVSIRDNGVGIASKYTQRIFGPFEQLYPPGECEGTGIGLAIVKQGVERMKGRVGLESKPGAGSTFWIELPEAGG